jgi:hypothetical protein
LGSRSWPIVVIDPCIHKPDIVKLALVNDGGLKLLRLSSSGQAS